MTMSLETISAFQCQGGPSVGSPHDWDYRRLPRQSYRCRLCLVVITKADLKELTDNA